MASVDVQVEIKGVSATSEIDKEKFTNGETITTGTTNTLSFHNLKYSVKVGRPFKKVDKRILRDVSGIFEPGLNAIMGPTGGGKTSLLDLLAKRKDSKGLEGEVLLNGRPVPKNFKLISGYVVQDDVVMGTLTVKENLEFAANLRMRGNLTSKQKADWVDELIKELGLEKCENTKVGTELIKGVSGGERKRCNIGIELVTKPPVLFLDEPTTGLDASTSHSVMNLLRDLTVQGNRTIVFSIHQPRYSIFRLFDRLHLLSSHGQTVFHGPASQAVDYFARHNLVCETYNNPADFFLDIILENSDSSEMNEDQVREKEVEEKIPMNGKSEKKNLPHFFSESVEYQKIQADCKTISLNASNSADMPGDHDDLGYATNWFAQFVYLSIRSLKNLLRNPQTSIAPSVMMIILSLLVGTLYIDWTTDLNGFQNVFGALFFATLQMMFGNMAALEVFVNGRSLFLHESANGFYRVSSYFVSKVVCDLLPLRAIPTVLFSTIFYIMLGLKADLGYFVFFLFVNMTTTMAACSLAFFFSVLTGVFAVAQALVSVSYIIMVLFAGLILNVTSMPEILQALKYVSIPRYCLAAHASAQITDLNFCGEMTFMGAGGNRTEKFVCQSGEELLDKQGIGSEVTERWMNCAFLIIFTAFFFSITYIVLRTMQKRK